MSNIVLGCDSNGVNDEGCRDTIAGILEKAGNEVEKLGIAPGPFADYSYSSSASGKIGVYIMADSIVSIADLVYGNTNFKYGYFVIRGDLGLPRMSTMEHFQNNPIRPDSDCTSVCDKLAGKSYGEMNEIIKDRAHIVFGTTPEEMGENLVKAMGGSTDNSSSSTKSASSIKSCIQELLYPWNGEVYCRLQDDTIHIGRIPGPTNTKLVLAEGDNVEHDSISVTDINPDTPNKLIVTAGDTQYVIEDKERIKRFGEKKETVECNIQAETDIVDFAYREWNKLLKDSGRVLECRVTGDPKWRIGRWVRVFMPSFDLDGFMWITKCSHDDDSVWDTNLTLRDYPPDLGTEPSSSSDSNTDSASGS